MGSSLALCPPVLGFSGADGVMRDCCQGFLSLTLISSREFGGIWDG